MSHRLQNLRQEQNEFGYQHTLVSRVMLCLLCRLVKLGTCELDIEFPSLPLDAVCLAASLTVGKNNCNCFSVL
jgi:hypothetical protein